MTPDLGVDSNPPGPLDHDWAYSPRWKVGHRQRRYRCRNCHIEAFEKDIAKKVSTTCPRRESERRTREAAEYRDNYLKEALLAKERAAAASP